MKRFTGLLLVVYLLVSFPAHAQDCAGAAFRSGDLLVVNPSAAQNVREQPGTDSSVLTSVPVGEYLTVWGGPTCTGGYVWWQVEYDRQVGWTAEAPTDGGTTWLSQVEMRSLDQASLHLDYAPSLLSGVEVNDYDWQAHIANYIPPSRDYRLLDYPISMDDRPEYLRSPAHITIYPRGEQEDGEMNLDGRYELLHQVPLVPDALLTFMPFDPQVYRAPQFAYLHFNGGLGSRAVNYYEQTLYGGPGDFSPILPYYGYGFNGFTDDGLYYVSAYFPVQVDVTLPPLPALPTFTTASADSQEEVLRLYNEYSLQSRQLVDSLPPEAFTPRLALLDALVRSLTVTQPIELHFDNPQN